MSKSGPLARVSIPAIRMHCENVSCDEFPNHLAVAKPLKTQRATRKTPMIRAVKKQSIKKEKPRLSAQYNAGLMFSRSKNVLYTPSLRPHSRASGCDGLLNS